jgi:hypothetical protein
VAGLGYDLVEAERARRGPLRVMIDRILGDAYPEARGAGEFVTIDDGEVATRQLQLALEVEAVAYERLRGLLLLGLDRPAAPGRLRALRRAGDRTCAEGSPSRAGATGRGRARPAGRGLALRELLPPAPAQARAGREGGQQGCRQARREICKGACRRPWGRVEQVDAPAAEAAAQELGFELGGSARSAPRAGDRLQGPRARPRLRKGLER